MNSPHDIARLLADSRRGPPAVQSRDVLPADRAGAHAVQDATLARIGPLGGWKVGASHAAAEPGCAPLPAGGLLASGAHVAGPHLHLRGIEVEAALRLGADLQPRGRLLPRAELAPYFEAVLPAIEVVETRLADWKSADPLAQMADLQSHGALVLGPDSAMAPAELDLRTLEAHLVFDGQPVAHTLGGNKAVDVWRLLAWLAVHAEQRGQPLRRGQIVTTGTCTGLLFAAEGAQVQAQVNGLGRVALTF